MLLLSVHFNTAFLCVRNIPNSSPYLVASRFENGFFSNDLINNIIDFVIFENIVNVELWIVFTLIFECGYVCESTFYLSLFVIDGAVDVVVDFCPFSIVNLRM